MNDPLNLYVTPKTGNSDKCYISVLPSRIPVSETPSDESQDLKDSESIISTNNMDDRTFEVFPLLKSSTDVEVTT